MFEFPVCRVFVEPKFGNVTKTGTSIVTDKSGNECLALFNGKPAALEMQRQIPLSDVAEYDARELYDLIKDCGFAHIAIKGVRSDDINTVSAADALAELRRLQAE